MASSEIWKAIPGYRGIYEVSNRGRVKALPRTVQDSANGGTRVRNYPERILQQHTVNKYGHLKVGLYKNKKCKEFLVHRLVLRTFVGKCPVGMEGLHNDGDCQNNKLRNLRWGSSKDNSADSIKHGTIARNKALPQTKLKESQARKIKYSGKPLDQLASRYGISLRQARQIRAGTQWTYL